MAEKSNFGISCLEPVYAGGSFKIVGVYAHEIETDGASSVFLALLVC
jgi:hypothetical protein